MHRLDHGMNEPFNYQPPCRRPIKVDGFVEALDFSHDTQSKNDSGARIVVGDTISVMPLSEI
jgi:hypothetical protein